MRVDSEALREVEYHAESRTLSIRFAEGGWWRYFEVPSQIHEELIAAESHGRYFHEHICDRFRYERCRPAEPR